jgi:hypothetical protein
VRVYGHGIRAQRFDSEDEAPEEAADVDLSWTLDLEGDLTILADMLPFPGDRRFLAIHRLLDNYQTAPQTVRKEVCRRLLLLTHPDKRNAEHLDNLPDGDAIFGYVRAVTTDYAV